jgi:tricorn protease
VPFRKFKRWLYGDKCKGKQALIMDVRYNGGGWLHDDLYAEFAKRPHAYEKTRDQPRHTMPSQYWDKPVVVLQNEYSGSDAEIVPSGMRYLGYGTLMGRPTYGGVIGTYDFTLLDGTTRCRVPCNGWWTMDDTNLENYGVPPDIDVENTFESVLEGRDLQLERAVEEAVKKIGK